MENFFEDYETLGLPGGPNELKRFTNGFIISERGQWDYPGLPTAVPTPSGRITTKGVEDDLLGIDNLGNTQYMTPDNEYQFEGDMVYEIPQARKGGSKKPSKKYSRSLMAKNKLFAKNPLFEKKKSAKNKIFDPNSPYFQPGGSLLSNMYVEDTDWMGDKYKDIGRDIYKNKNFKVSAGNYFPKNLSKQLGLFNPYVNIGYNVKNLGNFSLEAAPQNIGLTFRRSFQPGGETDLPQNVGISYLPEDGRSYYDPLSDTINLNPNASDAELNHELVHAWQNRTGRLRSNPNLPQQRPPIVASDEQAASYYTRKGDDVDFYLNNLSTLHPDLTGGNIWTEDLNRFIPDQVKYDKVVDPLMYLDPNTMEGEAEYLSQTRGRPGGIGFRQNGGITKLSPEEEIEFQKFYATLPENLQTDDATYDIRGYWDSEGRPEKFNYDQPKESDGYYHAYSINSNTGEYLKSPVHETFQHAVDEDRKIGWRPITNVYGRNIATENPLIATEEQSFLRNIEGPSSYIETELTDDEINEYRKGGYIVEDISVPSLTRMQPGGPVPDSTYTPIDPNFLAENPDTYSKIVNKPEVTSKRQGSDIGKLRAEFREKNPIDTFLDEKKRQYLKKNKGLNKAAGVTMENFPEDVLQNFMNEYDYKTNNYAVNKLGKKEGWNPKRRGEWVDELTPGERDAVAESKYGSKLQPSYWSRALAGTQELGNFMLKTIPGVKNDVLKFNIPGLTKKEQKEIRESKLGALETLASLDIPGAAIANLAKNTGLSTGSDYKEQANALAGEKMSNVSDMEALAFNPLTYAGLEALPELALNVPRLLKDVGVGTMSFIKNAKEAETAAKALYPGITKMGFSGLGKEAMFTKEIPYPDYYLDIMKLNKYSPKQEKYFKDLIETIKKQNGKATELQYEELQRIKTGDYNYGKRGNPWTSMNIEKQSAPFKSEIDWVDWVKKHNKNYDAEDIQNIIRNSEEYNIIEQQTKANGTWMKNADGTPFQGPPEQFIQQQSTKFKKAYPEGTEITYRGGDKRDAVKSDWSDKSNVVFTTKDEYGARAYNKTLDQPPLSLTEAPPEGISQLYMPKTSNKIVIDGNEYPIGHKYRSHGLPYTNDAGKVVYSPGSRTNYARLNVIDQVPANELEAKNLEAFKTWMLEKHPTMTERGWHGEPRILNDWVMTDHFADFLNSPAGRNIDRVEFQKILDGTLEPIDVEVHNLNEAQQLKSMWGNSGEFDLTNPSKFKALLPYLIPTGLGVGAASQMQGQKSNEEYKNGGIISELTKKEIDKLIKQGYIIEEVSEHPLTKASYGHSVGNLIRKDVGGSISGTQGLTADFSQRLTQFILDAKAQGIDLGIGSGYRSYEKQKRLWEQALKKYGSPEKARKWVAPPGGSFHNKGLAVDLNSNGQFLGKDANSKATEWAHANAKKYGLHFRMGHEPWHIEPIEKTKSSSEHDHVHDDDVIVDKYGDQPKETTQEEYNKMVELKNMEFEAKQRELEEKERALHNDNYSNWKPARKEVVDPIQQILDQYSKIMDLSNQNVFEQYNTNLQGQMKDGGFIMELTDKEIDRYRKGGYIIEELD